MMTPSTKPSRRILLRTVAVIVGLVAVLVALVAGILAPYYFSLHLAQTSLLTLTAIVAFGLVAWLGMRLGAALWRTNQPARFAITTATALTIVFFVALYFIILRPLPLRYTEVVAAENGKYWHLPTGSTISYQEFLPPAGTEVRPDPDRPYFFTGARDFDLDPSDSEIYSNYAADGFRVYLYDQTGKRRVDAFAPRKGLHTIARAVEDLGSDPTSIARRANDSDRPLLGINPRSELYGQVSGSCQ